MVIDGWVLVNLLCLGWSAVTALVVAVLALEIQGLRFWIPNRSQALLDLAQLAMLAGATAGGILVAVVSFIALAAVPLAALNLACALALGLYVLAAAVSIPGSRSGTPPTVGPTDGTDPGPGMGEVTVLAGGDVSFDRRLEGPVVSFRSGRLGTLATTLTWLTRAPAYPVPRLLARVPGDDALGVRSSFEPVPIPGDAARLEVDVPCRGLKEVFAEADVVAVNLESPLAEPGRFEGYRLTSAPMYAETLRDAGVDLVNLANNHCFDAGEAGLLQTFEALGAAGVSYVGAGSDLAAARRGAITDKGGVRIAWLGYTQKMGRVTLDFAAATPDRFGCVPLDPDVVCEDIEAARRDADLVVVTPHWGVEEKHGVSRTVRRLGHQMIEAGAAAVLGHGPHLYQGIEVHRGRPIVYSLGTLIFGTRSRAWKDNILAKLVVAGGAPVRLEVIPVAGDRASLLQPAPLHGARAGAVLDHLGALSRRFGTTLRRVGDRGVIDLALPASPGGSAPPGGRA